MSLNSYNVDENEVLVKMTKQEYTEIVTRYAYGQGASTTDDIINFVTKLINKQSEEFMTEHQIRRRCLNDRMQQAAAILAIHGEIPYDPDSIMPPLESTMEIQQVTHTPVSDSKVRPGSISLTLNADVVMKELTAYCYKHGLTTPEAVSNEMRHLSSKAPNDYLQKLKVDIHDIQSRAFISLVSDGKLKYSMDAILI